MKAVAVVTGDRPEPATLGPAAAGIEHRRAGLVHEQLRRGLQALDQAGVDRAQLTGGVADPVGERRAVERQALAAR